jgi:hypothetical protein
VFRADRAKRRGTHDEPVKEEDVKVVDTLKRNQGIAVGAALGGFVAPWGTAQIQKLAQPIAGGIAGRWMSTASALLGAALALWLGEKFGKVQIGTAVAGVFIGTAINSGAQALKG